MKLGSAVLSVYMRVYIYKLGTKESMVLHRMYNREYVLSGSVRFFCVFISRSFIIV